MSAQQRQREYGGLSLPSINVSQNAARRRRTSVGVSESDNAWVHRKLSFAGFDKSIDVRYSIGDCIGGENRKCDRGPWGNKQMACCQAFDTVHMRYTTMI